MELKPSTSGIVQDPQTGDRKVAPSKRPDGTLRKEIKIRPGFTPQEDISKFRSARQVDSNSRQLPKGSVVGFIRPQVAVAQSALKGMSEAQKKNVKRKEKRKAAAAQEAQEDVPEQWDVGSNRSHTPDHSNGLATTTTHQAGPVAPSFSETSNPSHPAQENPTPDPDGREGVKLFTNAMQQSLDGRKTNSSEEATESNEKKARAIRKKLTQAEQLKARHEKGEELLAEQLEKISKIDELQLELENLNLA